MDASTTPAATGAASTSAQSSTPASAAATAPASGSGSGSPAEPSGGGAPGDALPWDTILLVAGIVLAVALVVVLVVLLVRWRRKRAREAPAEPAPPALGDRLEDVWQPFYRQLPRHARHYPTVIVMGQAGAGKSQLIDTHVDWRGQANQYFPSAARGGPLQLYLGPGMIVHELSTALLRDLSRQAQRALTRLWRRVGPSVTVLVAVDARQLTTTLPDELRQLAQLVRGKIRLLPGRVRQAVEIRVCATHLDQQEGYAEFAQIMGNDRAPFPLEALGAEYDDARPWMTELEPHLAWALTRRSASEFRRFVSFHGSIPALASHLAPLLRSLAGDDPYAERRRLGGLYMSALLPDSQVGNPFTVDHAQIAESIAASRRWHLRYSTALAVVMLAAVTSLHVWHAGRLRDAQRALRAFEKTTAPGGAKPAGAAAAGAEPPVGERKLVHAARAAADAIERVHASEILWLGQVSRDEKRALGRDFTAAMRARLLLPRTAAGRDRLRLLYAMGLLYAARGDDLGALVLEHTDRWVDRLRLAGDLVREYVHNSAAAWDGLAPYPRTVTEDGPARWRGYLDALRAVFVAREISAAELAGIQARAPALVARDEYALLGEIAARLPDDPAIRDHLAPLLEDLSGSDWIDANYEALAGLTAMVRDARMELPRTDGWTLMQLMDELKRMAGMPAPPQVVYGFELDGQTYEFDRQSWDRMLVRARAGMLIAQVLRDIDQSQRPPFFRPDAFLPTIGPAVGATQGPTGMIRGRYTRQAFEGHVAPVLGATPGVLAQLDLDEDDATRLSSYVLAAASDYARAYREELTQYYRSFRFQVSTPDALPYALQALTGGPSWFTDFLRTVGQTASPSLGEGAYFEPMATNLQPFAAVVAVAAEANGSFPNLAPYTQVVSSIVSALDPGAASGGGGAGGGEDGGPALALSPLGAMVLDTVLGKAESHVSQVRAWLAGASIDRGWQAPFLAPIEETYALGYREIETAVNQAWQNQVLPQATPLLARFPFDRGASEEAAPADIEAALRAQGKAPGRFWSAFNALILPVTARGRDGRYRMRAPLRPPAGMLPLVNDAARLADALWDGDGNRVPLALRVTPRPLSKQPAGGRVPTLAYLKAGAAGVYAFNQQPSAQKLTVSWWDQGTASVGLQLTRPESNQNRYSSIDVSNADWSLWRLLRQAAVKSGGVRVWRVPVSSDGKTFRDVCFALEGDPWALFDLGGS